MTRAYVLAVLAAFGCEGSPEPTDAGGDAGPIVFDAAELMVAPPAPPTRVAWTCPDGWQEVVASEAQGCEPWPRAWEGCPAGEARFVGDTACAPFESDCPGGEWADDLPATGVRYVRAGAVGGDGTLALPFGRVQDAVAAASEGDVVAIGRGTYDERIRVSLGITLRGTCPAETQIRSVTPVDGLFSSILADADGIVIERLTVSGALFGIDSRRAAVTIRSSVVSGAAVFGIVASDGASVTVEDVIVRDVHGGTSGSALVANLMSSLDLRRVIIEDSGQVGVIVFDEGVELAVRDVVIRRIHSGTDGVLGNGIATGRGAHLIAERVAVEHTRASGVVFTERGTGELSDIVVRDTVAQVDMNIGGTGISASGSSDIVVDRALISDNLGGGVTIVGSGTTLVGSDHLYLRTRATASPPFQGVALIVTAGAGVEVDRAHFEDNVYGTIAVESLSSAMLRDITVRNTATGSEGIGGRALNVALGSVATVERMEVSDGAESAFYAVHTDSVLNARDILVERTRSRPLDGAAGRGLTVVAGARAEIERAVFRESHEVAVIVFGAGSAATLTDVLVENTRAGDCVAEGRCEGGGGGSGIAAIEEADLTLVRFITRGSELAGLQIARDATVLVDTGIVEDNVIGANVQDVTFGLDVLRNGVIYRRNGVNLDASELTLPTFLL